MGSTKTNFGKAAMRKNRILEPTDLNTMMTAINTTWHCRRVSLETFFSEFHMFTHFVERNHFSNTNEESLQATVSIKERLISNWICSPVEQLNSVTALEFGVRFWNSVCTYGPPYEFDFNLFSLGSHVSQRTDLPWGVEIHTATKSY